MRYSSLLGKTLREKPQDAKSESQVLLLRGGFIRSLGSGLVALLPLGVRVMERLTSLVRRNMDELGGQEVHLPLVGPLEIWEKSGRDRYLSDELVRFKDRSGQILVLSPTHEESMVELVKASLNSYREFPIFLYQFQSKFRDEEKVRDGLIRAREFVMKDAYSFHRSYSDLNHFFPRVFGVYKKIFEQCGLGVLACDAGVGVMGGSRAFEFLMPAVNGDVTAVLCSSCGYAANQEVAKGNKIIRSEMPVPIQLVATPGCDKLDRLAKFLQLPRSALAKVQVFETSEGPVMTVVRADQDVSLEKLSRVFGQVILRKLPRAALEALGLTLGYFSPIDQELEMKVVVDDGVANSSNLVFGANKEGFCYTGVNFGRDFESALVGDIVKIGAHETCAQCNAPLKEIPSYELGHIFKLDDIYPRKLGLSFQDERNRTITPSMGCYGIGMGRLMAAVAESNHDARGLLWPKGLAPFDFYLMTLGDSLRVQKVADDLEKRWVSRCLYDDRRESAGTKFADSDLLGIPLRVCISRMLLERGLVELKDRRTGEVRHVVLDQIDSEIMKFLGEFNTHA